MDTVNIDVELMIALVQERGVLWDKSLEDYKSRSLTVAAWREVCCELQDGYESLDVREQHLFGKHVVKKWTNVKDCWLKAQRKDMDLGKSSIRGKTGKKYIYQKHLSFLNKNIGVLDNDTESSSTMVEKPCGSLRGDVSTSRGERLAKKKRRLDEVEVPVVPPTHAPRVVEVPEPEDRHLSFFRGILPAVKELNEDETLQFQMGVLNVLQGIRNARAVADIKDNVL